MDLFGTYFLIADKGWSFYFNEGDFIVFTKSVLGEGSRGF
jgi:hypothetical protein